MHQVLCTTLLKSFREASLAICTTAGRKALTGSCRSIVKFVLSGFLVKRQLQRFGPANIVTLQAFSAPVTTQLQHATKRQHSTVGVVPDRRGAKHLAFQYKSMPLGMRRGDDSCLENIDEPRRVAIRLRDRQQTDGSQ